MQWSLMYVAGGINVRHGLTNCWPATQQSDGTIHVRYIVVNHENSTQSSCYHACFWIAFPSLSKAGKCMYRCSYVYYMHCFLHRFHIVHSKTHIKIEIAWDSHLDNQQLLSLQRKAVEVSLFWSTRLCCSSQQFSIWSTFYYIDWATIYLI